LRIDVRTCAKRDARSANWKGGLFIKLTTRQHEVHNTSQAAVRHDGKGLRMEKKSDFFCEQSEGGFSHNKSLESHWWDRIGMNEYTSQTNLRETMSSA